MPADTIKKNSRRGHKSSLTREINLAKRSIALDREEDVESSFNKLERKFEDFEHAHNDYHGDLTDEQDVIESEDYFEAVENDYVNSLLFIRKWLDSRKNPSSPKDTKPGNLSTPTSADELSRSELLSLMHLPKLELCTFDGDPLQYHSFTAIFDEHVEKVAKDPQIKLTRLLQCCVGPAKEAIRAYSLIGGEMGYKEARKTLHTRFGNDHLICSRLIGNLKSGKAIRSPGDLQCLADELSTCHATLSSLRKLHEVDTQSSIIEIASRLQPYIKSRWKRQAMEMKRERDVYPDFTYFVQFVVAEAAEASDPVYGSFSTKASQGAPGEGKKRNYVPSATSASFVSSSKPRRPDPPCVVCRAAHRLFKCDGFKRMKPQERLEVVKTNKLCENCLLDNHATIDCRKPSVCSVPNCGEKHTKFIHVNQNSHPNLSLNSASAYQADVISAQVKSNQSVLLPIVEVVVNDKQNVCALLDTGSTNSFCTKRLVNSLNIKGHAVDYSLSTLTSLNDLKQTKIVNLKLVSVDGEHCLKMSNVYVVDEIPVGVPCGSLCEYDHLKDIPVPESPSKVDVLIGQDHSEALFPLETRRGGSGEPFAVRSLLGWSVNGPVCHRPVSRRVVANFITTGDVTTDDGIKSMWDVEQDNFCDVSVTWSSEDKSVIQLWDDTVRLTEGHYELPIPWRPNVQFSSNLSQAMCRLLATVKSVEKRGLRPKYDEEIAKILDKGYAEIVQNNQIESKVWYLPHHAVINPRKPSKLRVVFDCAAKHQGKSLNDRCFQGPDMNNKLVDVLLRFRQHQYAVMGDIESMYHQVKIPVYDRNTLRFLWYNQSGDVMHYRMTSHLFGGVWCASSSTYALRRLLHDHSGVDDAVADVVRNSFYVDDCLISVPDVDEAIEIIRQTTSLLIKGGFRLRKFVTNNDRVLSSIPLDDRATEAKDLATCEHSKVLGVKWDVASDKLYFDVNVDDAVTVTKRSILSTVSSIFDPLGFVNPIVISGRLLFQEVVRLKLGWDDVVPPEILRKWKRWLEAVNHLSSFQVPRCFKPSDFDDAAIQLHHFCDASLSAYGFSTYVRSVNKQGKVLVQLLLSKSRVSPLKPLTIPRLELQAAVLAARADKALHQILTVPLIRSCFWTDSEIVIRYIKNESLRFNVFVGNRITEIRKSTNSSQWNHVAGKDNPADLLTRGNDPRTMDMDKWLHGAKFLHTYESEWSKGKVDLQVPVDDPEVKGLTQSPVCHATAMCDLSAPIDTLANHYSSWFRLKKAVSWWARLKDRLRTKVQVRGRISVVEMMRAEIAILKHVQSASYSDECTRLAKGESLSKSSPIYDLSPYMDRDGLIRVGGRIKHAAVGESMLHPVIVPHKHVISILIIRDFHCSAHVGVEWTLSLLRQRFWITKARPAIKRIVKGCIQCKRLNSAPLQQKMADLPPERLQPGDPPFTYVGLDCFGPFMVKYGRSQIKRYGCIFTCLTTRAVHLEMLHSLSADDFLNGFRRFIARRGNPRKVFSDNGTNFVGGQTELSNAKRELNHKLKDHPKLHQQALKNDIEWVSNPPHASHMGGVWERLIRSIRKALTCLLHTNPVRLTDDILSTLFCEIESILNNRPLTKVSAEVSDLSPLTPNHLLLMRGGPDPPPGLFSEGDMYRRRWKYVQSLASQFWSRWVSEYLPELQRRHKWVDESRNLKVNDLVLLCGENTPRSLWPLAVVVEVTPGKDGLVRSVKVRTRSTTLVRPITKIVLLEGE